MWRGRTRIDLTPTEYKLLRYLMHNARRVLSKAQILDHVWEYDFDGDANVVETYVSYLRKKLDPHGPPLIHTVRGVGYRLRLPLPGGRGLTCRSAPASRSVSSRSPPIGLVLAGLATFGALRSFLFDRVDAQLDSVLERPPPGTRAVVLPAGGYYEVRTRTGTSCAETTRSWTRRIRRTRRRPSSRRRFPTARSRSTRSAATRTSASRPEQLANGNTFVVALPLDDVRQTLRRLVFVELIVAVVVLGALARSAGGSSDSGCAHSNA